MLTKIIFLIKIPKHALPPHKQSLPSLKVKSQSITMGGNATGQITQEERQKRWQMAYTARMRQIVPGLYLGNVEASHKREMLQENHINAIVSLTDARWV